MCVWNVLCTDSQSQAPDFILYQSHPGLLSTGSSSGEVNYSSDAAGQACWSFGSRCRRLLSVLAASIGLGDAMVHATVGLLTQGFFSVTVATMHYVL